MPTRLTLWKSKWGILSLRPAETTQPDPFREKKIGGWTGRKVIEFKEYKHKNKAKTPNKHPERCIFKFFHNFEEETVFKLFQT